MTIDVSGYLLGATPPKVDFRTIPFEAILEAGLDPPPNAITNSQRVGPWLMLGNNQYGDCVMAALAHFLMLVAALLGGRWTISEQQVIATYLQLTGGVDRGLVILDVLKWALKSPFWDGKRILAFASVNAKDMNLMAKAVELCGATFRGMGLPVTAQRQVGTLWDFVQGPGNGVGSWGWHATIGTDYNLAGRTTGDITWGMIQPATFAFWGAYQTEQYAIITEDTPQINRAKLETILKAISDGNYYGPTPAPDPTPVPPPNPPSPEKVYVYASKAAQVITYPDGKTQSFGVGLSPARETSKSSLLKRFLGLFG